MEARLNTAKFRKVYGLMAGGATDGERTAAKARAEAMAARAGMTLAQAVSSLDAHPTTKPTNILDGFDDWMEEKEPGYKAEQARWRAEREAKRQARCHELLKEFGSEDAVFTETDRERLLRVTLEPLADRSTYFDSTETYISGYAGWTCRKPPPTLWDAIERAYPLPSDIHSAWAEYREWERLTDARCTFSPEFDNPIWVRARQAALEHLMDTMPSLTFEGFALRLEWLEHLNGRGFSRDVTEDAALIAAMRSDFTSLAQAVHSGRRTTADKQAAVLSMLDAFPELSDREIARRVGVSPQTVNNWRRRSSRGNGRRQPPPRG